MMGKVAGLLGLFGASEAMRLKNKKKKKKSVKELAKKKAKKKGE